MLSAQDFAHGRALVQKRHGLGLVRYVETAQLVLCLTKCACKLCVTQMSFAHRPSLTETADVIFASASLDYNAFCDAAAEMMPPLPDCGAPWQWHDPAWVHDLLVDACYRLPGDGMPTDTLHPSEELVCMVHNTFPCLRNYAVLWFIEHLYRHMGRHCVDVAAEQPRDTTNYMAMSPTMTVDEDNAVSELVCLGQSCGCVRMVLRECYTTQARSTVRFSLLSPCIDEQGMAEYEERARACLVEIASRLHVVVQQLRYTPRWGAHGVPTYTVHIVVTSRHAD